MLADILGEHLLRYGLDGRLRAKIPKPANGPLSYDRPSAVLEGTEGRYVLQTGSTLFLTSSADFEPVAAMDLIRRGARWGEAEEGMIGGTVGETVWRDQFVALSPIAAQERVLYATIRLDPTGDGPAWAEPANGIGVAEERFLSTTSSWVAGNRHGAYAVIPDEGRLALWQIAPDHERLKALPPNLVEMVQIPEFGGREGSVASARFRERSRLPHALYGRGDDLFLLAREPADGATRWLLHQIDPVGDRLVRTLTLSTRAPHLFLIPGAEQWAVIEKGPVTGIGIQEIRSALLLPTAWIEDEEVSILIGATERDCPPPSRSAPLPEPPTSCHVWR